MNIMSEIEDLKEKIHKRQDIERKYYLKGRLDGMLWIVSDNNEYKIMKSEREILEKASELKDELKSIYDVYISEKHYKTRLSSGKDLKRIRWIEGFIDVLNMAIGKDKKEDE